MEASVFPLTDSLLDATLLIVDDVAENLNILGQLLRSEGYRVRAATNGVTALRYARQQPQPDLILLDVMMPDMDGHQVLAQLQADPVCARIPVIFVTALITAEDEEKGLRLGAVDFIPKPLRPLATLARVRAHLLASRARLSLQEQNTELEAEVNRRMKENDTIQLASIRALAHLAEMRDPETGNHLLRTQAYVGLLAEKLSTHPYYAETLSPDYIQWITRSAPLHDIGKVGIPDYILLKAGKLTDDERAIMQTHALLGSVALERAEHDLQGAVHFLTHAKAIARSHHERWDGKGYPDGLAGEAIPLSARIMAIGDVFDALVSPRVYKPPMPLEQARELISNGRGTHFDPDLTDTFLGHFEAFAAIARTHADPPEEAGPDLLP